GAWLWAFGAVFCLLSATLQGTAPSHGADTPHKPQTVLNEHGLVDGQIVILTVAGVVDDHPEHINDFQDIVVLVQELDGCAQVEQGFHAFIGYQRVRAAGAFVDVMASAGHPIVFLVTQAAGQDVAGHHSAVTVTTQGATLVGTHDVHRGVVANIKAQVTQPDIGAERNPGRGFFRRIEVAFNQSVFVAYLVDALFDLDVGWGAVLGHDL